MATRYDSPDDEEDRTDPSKYGEPVILCSRAYKADEQSQLENYDLKHALNDSNTD